jgi:hypothetical protein
VAETAPPYWSLDTAASPSPDIGASDFHDAMTPPLPGWVRNAVWSVNAGVYTGSAAKDRFQTAAVPLAPSVASFDMSVDVRLIGDAAGTGAGLECRGAKGWRYLFVVRSDGLLGVLRSETFAKPPQFLWSESAYAPVTAQRVHVSIVCLTLHLDARGATNRLLAFLNGRLLIDRVDDWPGQTSRLWTGGLVVYGGTAPAVATFANVDVRDFSLR